MVLFFLHRDTWEKSHNGNCDHPIKACLFFTWIARRIELLSYINEPANVPAKKVFFIPFGLYIYSQGDTIQGKRDEEGEGKLNTRQQRCLLNHSVRDYAAGIFNKSWYMVAVPHSFQFEQQSRYKKHFSIYETYNARHATPWATTSKKRYCRERE